MNIFRGDNFENGGANHTQALQIASMMSSHYKIRFF
jgi:hypothetical protein